MPHDIQPFPSTTRLSQNCCYTETVSKILLLQQHWIHWLGFQVISAPLSWNVLPTRAVFLPAGSPCCASLPNLKLMDTHSFMYFPILFLLHLHPSPKKTSWFLHAEHYVHSEDQWTFHCKKPPRFSDNDWTMPTTSPWESMWFKLGFLHSSRAFYVSAALSDKKVPTRDLHLNLPRLPFCHLRLQYAKHCLSFYDYQKIYHFKAGNFGLIFYSYVF